MLHALNGALVFPAPPRLVHHPHERSERVPVGYHYPEKTHGVWNSCLVELPLEIGANAGSDSGSACVVKYCGMRANEAEPEYSPAPELAVEQESIWNAMTEQNASASIFRGGRLLAVCACFQVLLECVRPHFVVEAVGDDVLPCLPYPRSPSLGPKAFCAYAQMACKSSDHR